MPRVTIKYNRRIKAKLSSRQYNTRQPTNRMAKKTTLVKK
jgi:hypothetical protein